MDHIPAAAGILDRTSTCACGRDAPTCDGDGIQAFLHPLGEFVVQDRKKLRKMVRQQLGAAAAHGLEDDAADLRSLWADWLRLPLANLPKELLGPTPGFDASSGPPVQPQNDWWQRRKAAGLPRLAPVPAAIRRRFRQLLVLPRVPLLHRLRPEVLRSCAQGRPYTGAQADVFLEQPRLQLSQTLDPAVLRGASGHLLLAELTKHSRQCVLDAFRDIAFQTKAGLAIWRSSHSDWNEPNATDQHLLMRIVNRLLLDGRGWDPLVLLGWILEDISEALFLADAFHTDPLAEAAGPLFRGPLSMPQVWRRQLCRLATFWSSKIRDQMDPWDEAWLSMCMSCMYSHLAWFQVGLGAQNPDPLNPPNKSSDALSIVGELVRTHPVQAVAHGHSVLLQLAVAGLLRNVPQSDESSEFRDYYHHILVDGIQQLTLSGPGSFLSISREYHEEPAVYEGFVRVLMQMNTIAGERLLQVWGERFPDPQTDASEDLEDRLRAPSPRDMNTLFTFFRVMGGSPPHLPYAPAWTCSILEETVACIDPRVARGKDYVGLVAAFMRLMHLHPEGPYPVSAGIFDGECPPDQSPRDCPRLWLLYHWFSVYKEDGDPAFDELDFACHSCFQKLPTLHPEISRLCEELLDAPDPANLPHDFFDLMYPVLGGLAWRLRPPRASDRRMQNLRYLLQTHAPYWRALVVIVHQILQMPSCTLSVPPGMKASLDSVLDLMDPQNDDRTNEAVRMLPALERRRTLRRALAELEAQWDFASSPEGIKALVENHELFMVPLYPVLQKRLREDPMIADYLPEQPGASDGGKGRKKKKKKPKKKKGSPQTQAQEDVLEVEEEEQELAHEMDELKLELPQDPDRQEAEKQELEELKNELEDDLDDLEPGAAAPLSLPQLQHQLQQQQEPGGEASGSEAEDGEDEDLFADMPSLIPDDL